MMRPLVNIDYLLLGMVAPWLHPGTIALAFGFIFFNDFFLNLLPIYHFQLTDFLSSYGALKYTHYSALHWKITKMALPIFASVPLVYWLEKNPNRQRIATVGLLSGILVFVCLLDIANGTSYIPIRSSASFLDFNVANSGFRKTFYTSKETLFRKKSDFNRLNPDEYATGQLHHVYPKRLVIVIVESMGYFLKPELKEQLFEPLEKLKFNNNYSMTIGSVPFDGMTRDGELRELCGIRMWNFGNEIPDCLPKILSQKGYETISYHGFTNQFFNRYQWYPIVGFKHSFFAEEFQALGLRSCGSGFRGICDSDIAKLIRQELLRPGDNPKLLYWMTLNSHVPVEKESAIESNYDCKRNKFTANDSTLCIHTSIIHLVLSKITEIINDPKLPPTTFLIVGDHSPPFMIPERRILYSNKLVPFVYVSPKSNSHQSLAKAN